jgi:hypothetical protein
MAFSENLSLFLRDFGEAVQMGPEGSEVTITAIFDDEYYEVEGAYAPVSTSSPAITCESADVSAVVEGTRFVARGTEYEAVNPEPDGTGMTVIRLHKV